MLQQTHKIWANLLHLSFNMWEDRIPVELSQSENIHADYWDVRGYRFFLQFDEGLWNDLLQKMSKDGLNMVVLDLGDGVQYKSHPEIAIENAWTTGKLQEELAKMRSLGLEPIPKLNFATTHDAWMGEYARMVSTPAYYQVCRDLMAEVIELFDTPRFFHIGMDEETAGHQRYYEYLVVRQYDLYWHDFHFYCDEVAKGGSRPWIWSDKFWHTPEAFLKEMPKSVLQSNWYYGTNFDDEPPERRNRFLTYVELDKHGFEQVPTASNHSNSVNFGLTVEYCAPRIDPSRLLGFMQTPWRPTTEQFRQHHIEAIDQVAQAKQKFESEA